MLHKGDSQVITLVGRPLNKCYILCIMPNNAHSPEENGRIVAYYRVSTKQQEVSGLGLDAQRQAVERYTQSKGWVISAEFTEVETGTNKRQRTEIYNAIDAAKHDGCTLVIAKLDRLARSVSFISTLMDSKVDFVACDLPDASPLTVHIMAAMAEHEAKEISQRTKAALRAKRLRDGEWRISQLNNEARQRSLATRREKARKKLQQATYTANLLRDAGFSFQKIANKLNEQGYATSRGRKFKAMTVRRLLDK